MSVVSKLRKYLYDVRRCMKGECDDRRGELIAILTESIMPRCRVVTPVLSRDISIGPNRPRRNVFFKTEKNKINNTLGNMSLGPRITSYCNSKDRMVESVAELWYNRRVESWLPLFMLEYFPNNNSNTVNYIFQHRFHRCKYYRNIHLVSCNICCRLDNFIQKADPKKFPRVWSISYANEHFNNDKIIDCILFMHVLLAQIHYDAASMRHVEHMLRSETQERCDALTAAAEEFMPKSVTIMVARYID